MLSKLMATGLLATLLLAGACMGLLSIPSPPQPDVTLPKRSLRLRFEMGADVCDRCVLAAQEGFAETELEGWHSLLETAFRLGIAPSFEAPEQHADLTLRIVRADPHVEVSGRLPSGDAYALVSRIRYEAELLDASGRLLKVTLGDATSGSAPGRFSKRAIEKLFEEIAERLLAQLPGR